MKPRPGYAFVATFVYGTREHVPDLMVMGGVTYRYVTDHLGTVRMVVNSATGSVVQRIDYDEFGVVTNDTNPGWQPFGFAGGAWDADTGLVRFGARDYDAVTGRWTARDPILFDGGQTNLYVYSSGNPLNAIDPSGLDDWWYPSRDEHCHRNVHNRCPAREPSMCEDGRSRIPTKISLLTGIK